MKKTDDIVKNIFYDLENNTAVDLEVSGIRTGTYLAKRIEEEMTKEKQENVVKQIKEWQIKNNAMYQ